MVDVKVTGGELEQKEIDAYIKRTEEKYPTLHLVGLEIRVDGDFVELKPTFDKLPKFDRIRRITGYLVGTIDRWNDAKAAEERDRVKHSVSCSCCEGK